MGILDAVVRKLRGLELPQRYLSHPLGLGTLASDLSMRGQADMIHPLYRYSEVYRPEHFKDFNRAAFSYGSVLQDPSLVEWPEFPSKERQIELPNEGLLGYTPNIDSNLNLEDLYFKHPVTDAGYPAADHPNVLADLLATFYKEYPNIETILGVAPTPRYSYPRHVKNATDDRIATFLSEMRNR